MRSVILVAGLVACGRGDYDGVPYPPAGACDWAGGPEIAAVTSLDLPDVALSEWDPFLSAEGAEFLFNRGDGVVLESHRRADGGFDAPAPYPDLAVQAADRFEMSASETFAVVSSYGPGGLGQADLYTTVRSSPAEPWGELSPITSINSPDHEADPHLAADGLDLWYAVARPGSAWDIYRSHRDDPSGPFPAGTIVEELSDSLTDASPALTADQRVVVFTSGRTGRGAIWYSTRASVWLPFERPRQLVVPGAWTAVIEPFVSRDGCEVFFAGVPADSPDQRLYVAELGP